MSEHRCSRVWGLRGVVALVAAMVGCAGQRARVSVPHVTGENALLFKAPKSGFLLTTPLGKRLASWDRVCGDLTLYKVHVAATRGVAAFTCVQGNAEVSLRVLSLRPGARPSVVRDRKSTMVGWSLDDRYILAFDNAIEQRGVIYAIDPDTGAIARTYCCSEVALPGPAETVIGLRYFENETRISVLRPGSVRMLAVLRGFVSEVEPLRGTTRLVLGLRPRRDDYSRYKLVELDAANAAHRLIAKFAGRYWMHRPVGAGILINQVADGCVRHRRQSWPSPYDCASGWMFLTPSWVQWDGRVKGLGRASSVSGYWLREDGVIYAREFALNGGVLVSYLRTPDGRTLRFSETAGVGDPYWAWIDWTKP